MPSSCVSLPSRDEEAGSGGLLLGNKKNHQMLPSSDWVGADMRTSRRDKKKKQGGGKQVLLENKCFPFRRWVWFGSDVFRISAAWPDPSGRSHTGNSHLVINHLHSSFAEALARRYNIPADERGVLIRRGSCACVALTE